MFEIFNNLTKQKNPCSTEDATNNLSLFIWMQTNNCHWNVFTSMVWRKKWANCSKGLDVGDRCQIPDTEEDGEQVGNSVDIDDDSDDECGGWVTEAMCCWRAEIHTCNEVPSVVSKQRARCRVDAAFPVTPPSLLFSSPPPLPPPPNSPSRGLTNSKRRLWWCTPDSESSSCRTLYPSRYISPSLCRRRAAFCSDSE